MSDKDEKSKPEKAENVQPVPDQSKGREHWGLGGTYRKDKDGKRIRVKDKNKG